MGLTLPNYKIIIKVPCSLEQFRYAIGGHLLSPGATNLSSGAAVGLVKGNQFSLRFIKRSKNFWRPEFKGDFYPTNNHVEVVVRCGLSGAASVCTAILWSIYVLLFIPTFLTKIMSAGADLNDVLLGGANILFIFVLPWIAFWGEFRYDRDKMRSILDAIEKEG